VRGAWPAIGVGAAVAALTLISGHQIALAHPPAHLGRDVRLLEAAGIDHAWSNYWLAYRLTFESGERIVSSPARHFRYLPYVEAIRADPTPAVVFVAGDRRAGRFRGEIRQADVRYHEVDTPHLVAFTFPTPTNLERFDAVLNV
jgi:hypothetical protein